MTATAPLASTPPPTLAARAPTPLLACLSLSMLLSALGTSIANVALPTLAHAFGASFAEVQWVVLAYLLAITTLIVSVGRLGDLLGRRRLMLAGLALFTLASALCAATPWLAGLIAARVLQGVGAAIMMALTMAFASDVVSQDRTGRVMGLLGTMTAIGTALGPTLGGGLIAIAGWPSLFLVNVPLGLLAMGLAWRHLPRDDQRASRSRFDVAGSLMLAMTIAAYALAMTVGGGRFDRMNIALLALAVVAAWGFVRVQARAASPLLSLSLLRQPSLRPGLATNALVATVMMTTLVVGPFYLGGALGLDPARVGLVMSCGPLVAALAGVPAGRCVDRFGAGRMMRAGLAAMIVGAALLSLAGPDGGIVAYVASLSVLTASYALFQAANNSAVMTGAAPAQRGAVSGVLNLSRNLGLITGASLMGAVFAWACGAGDPGAASPAPLAAGMRVTYRVASVLLALAWMLAWASARSGARQGAGR